MLYCSSCPLPPYAYIPGKNLRHVDLVLPPVPHSYRGINDPEFLARFRFGIDCFNHGYYWETHEALEGLWHLVGRQTSDLGKGLQSIILLSAAHLKTFHLGHSSVRAWNSANHLFQSVDWNDLKELGMDAEAYGRFLQNSLTLGESQRLPYRIELTLIK